MKMIIEVLQGVDLAMEIEIKGLGSCVQNNRKYDRESKRKISPG